MNSQATPDPDVASDHFYSAAVRRMLRVLPVFGLCFSIFAAWWYGAVVGIGFAAGAATSYLSFRSLNRAVHGLAARVVDAQHRERGYSLVWRFLLRYLLAGIVAYGIFKSSSQAFRGFLFGLCTPVAAMLTEAVVEAYAALRRGY